jgi:hypothetical protein
VVIVDRQVSTLGVTNQTSPQFVGIGDGVAECVTGRHDLNIVIKPCPEWILHWQALRLPSSESIFDAGVFAVLFYPVEFANETEHSGGLTALDSFSRKISEGH